jgi:hypothetical protein
MNKVGDNIRGSFFKIIDRNLVIRGEFQAAAKLGEAAAADLISAHL